MFKEGRRRGGVFGLFWHCIRINLSAAMQYRASFLVQVFGMVLNNAAFIFFWIILFERIGGDIDGYGLTEVMFLWALAAAGYGVSVVGLGSAPLISRIIYSGELDVYLLQPKPVLANLLFSRMQVSGLGDLAYGILLFLFTQELTLSGTAMFLLFTVLAALVFTSARVFYHSFTFFMGNAEDFASTASEMTLAFTTYPGSIFTGPTRWLLHSLIPAALVVFIPAELFKVFHLPTFLLLLGADASIVAAAVAMFYRGLRRYESGNRIGTRV